jgi:hypothetical protein
MKNRITTNDLLPNATLAQNHLLGAGFRVLVGCEESQTVCKAFRDIGIEAYSCDLQECSGGKPEWHLQMDLFKAIELIKPQLGIFHPPCTFMSRAGARWMYPTAGNICSTRFKQAMEAKEFFMKCLNADIPFIVVENPLPLKVVGLPKETQVIQPYEYGHKFSKRTHLWIKGLPKLVPTKIENEYVPYLPSNTGGAKRGQKATFKNISQKESSKTFQGVANAMARQWSEYVAACT